MASSCLSCPRDGQPLAPLPAHPAGTTCPACGGIQLRDASIKAALECEGMDLAKTRTLFDLPAPLPCPGCALPMKGLALNGIEVDLCDGCQAIWLDKGELEKMDASLKDPARRHPASPVSADDFGIFGGLGEGMLKGPFGNPEWGLWEDIADILRRF